MSGIIKTIRHQILVVFGFMLLCLTMKVQAATSSEYWALWDQSDEKATTTIDHSLWQELLNDYLEDMAEGQYRVH